MVSKESEIRDEREEREKMAIEFSILDFLQTIHMPWLDSLMMFITRFGNRGLFFIGMGIVLLLFPKHRKAGVCILASIIIEALICNVTLKPMVHRTRPYDINTGVDTLIRRPRDYSFPSGHTGVSFATAFALFFAKDWLWIPTTVLAALVAFTRLYLYVHFPTDVLGGTVVGVLAGYLANIIVEKMYSRSNNLQK